MLDHPSHKMWVDERKICLEPATSAQRSYTGVRRGWPACGRLESGQECVDIDVGQFLRLVGLVRETNRAVRVGGIQLQDQIFHVGWCPRCRRLPQSTMLQDLLDHLALRRVEEGDYFHFAAALRTDHGVSLVDSLDEHGPGLTTACRWQVASITLAGWFCRFFRLFSHAA